MWGETLPFRWQLALKKIWFSVTLANLWAWRDLYGMGGQPTPSSVISQPQAGDLHPDVPRKPALDLSPNKSEPPSSRRPRHGAVCGPGKKLAISEAVRPCICVNLGFPHFFGGVWPLPCLPLQSERTKLAMLFMGRIKQEHYFSIMFQHLPQKPCKCAK